MRSWRLAIVAVVVVACLAAPAPVAAQSDGPVDVPSLDSWLEQVSGPLTSVVVAFLISLAIEYWPAYQTWSTGLKRAVYFGLCLIVPVSAACTRALLGYVEWSLDPLLWSALWYGGQAGLAGTVMHVKSRRSRLAARAVRVR